MGTSRGREPIPAQIIAVEGPSGVGKTATSRPLAASLDAVWIAEALVRVQPKVSLEFDGPSSLAELEEILLEEEGRRFREAVTHRHRGRSVVLDTGCLGPITYSAGLARLDPRLGPALRKVAGFSRRLIREGRLGLADRTIYLDLGAHAVARRVREDPIGHPVNQAKLHARVARWERQLWLDRFRGLEPDRLLVVRADGPIPDTIERALRQLASREPIRPPSERSAARAVRTFIR